MIEERTLRRVFKRRHACSAYQLRLAYKNYLKIRKLKTHEKVMFYYRGVELGFTQKQLEVLKLISRGFSNVKIAQKFKVKVATVKLLVYRLMRYLERILGGNIDRFYLVILAQELDLDHCMFNGNGIVKD